MTGEGPTVQAHATRATVSSTDVSADDRWPRLHGRVPAGLGPTASTTIEAGEQVLGTLTAYGRGDRPVAVEALELLAVTLVGVLHEMELLGELAQLETDMEQALRSRSVIDQAKGIVMATGGIDAESAWEHLVRLSSSQQLKVRVIAEQIVARASGRE
jgi:hypothetical protein